MNGHYCISKQLKGELLTHAENDSPCFLKKFKSSLWNLAKENQYGRYVSRAVGIIRMAGNEDKAVFSKRTCCPTLMTFCSEPLVGWFMMSMHRIRQGKKQVDVEKKDFEDKTGHSLLGCGLDSSLKMNEHFAPAAKPPPLKKPGAEAPGFFNLGI